MSQPSVASFFHSRKRTAIDDIFATKNKVNATSQDASAPSSPKLESAAPSKAASKIYTDDSADTVAALPDITAAPAKTRSGRRTPTLPVAPTAASSRPRRCLKPTATDAAATTKKSSSSSSSAAAAAAPQQQKIVKFTLAGHLSPKKKAQNDAARLRRSDIVGSVATALFANREPAANSERGLRTPTKADVAARLVAERAAELQQQLSADEIKARLTRSSRLAEMRGSMDKLRALQEQRDKVISTRAATAKTADKHSMADSQTERAVRMLGKSLRQFDTIELEVLSSPQKGLTTPTKQRTVPASPGGGSNSALNELMSPKKTATTPRRILFSPTKAGAAVAGAAASPTKSPSASLPAYQRYAALRDAGRCTLQLPYKYRCLAECFKCLDTVCAMFFNRHETITMKKLRPAVQRMLRKNFGEHELGQILAVWPEAYRCHQKKMLNAGSHTKYDYYQLVVTPNVTPATSATTGRQPSFGTMAAADDAGDHILRSGQQQSMNPQVIIERQQRFHQLLLDRVKQAHDTFLRAMDQPFSVPKDKITRWHLQFDLEACADVEAASLPQPPNVEKFSCARDILSTARNLFNCATPMERVMQRVEDKLAERQRVAAEMKMAGGPPTKTVAGTQQQPETDTESEPPTPTAKTGQTTCASASAATSADPVSALLKGLPKSLLERIRAKQAAKALDAMTRRPSQDKEAGKYERLPDLARYLRNIFVTESRNVLKTEVVLAKLENSFRERMSKERMRELLELIAREVPGDWLSFPHIADVHYVKIKKDVPLGEVIAGLERRAAEMA